MVDTTWKIKRGWEVNFNVILEVIMLGGCVLNLYGSEKSSLAGRCEHSI
jgi:hypothetical protein